MTPPGRGTENAVGMECPALSVQYVHFGSITDGIKHIKFSPHLLGILKQAVEDGIRLVSSRS